LKLPQTNHTEKEHFIKASADLSQRMTNKKEKKKEAQNLHKQIRPKKHL
jgi:hypothetical protein